MPPPSPTLREIGKACNVSAMTVSLVLRDAGSLSQETRERVKEVAAKMGYRRHPLRSLLGRETRAGKSDTVHSTLAWLYDTPCPKDLYEDAHLRAHLTGARERAAALGFAIDPVWLGRKDLRLRRLLEILSARGVSGVVFHALRQPAFLLDSFPFHIRPCVALGATSAAAPLTKVLSDTRANTLLALHHLMRQGFRRIGFLQEETSPTFDSEEAAATFLYFSQKFFEESPIPPFEIQAGDPASPRDRRLDEWLRRHQPDAIVSASGSTVSPVKEALTGRYGSPPVVPLNLAREQGDASGVTAHSTRLGAAAVTHLANLLVRNEPALLEPPMTVRIAGEWTGSHEISLPRTHTRNPTYENKNPATAV